MERKYTKEIDELLIDLFREEWMEDDDWVQFRRTIFTKSGFSYDELETAIDEGIKMGYTVKQQMTILRKQFKKNK